MTNKLISANMGIVLIMNVNGEEKTLEFSMTCPSNKVPQPRDLIHDLQSFLEEAFGNDPMQTNIQIAKLKIKAGQPRISHDEYNARIAEFHNG